MIGGFASYGDIATTKRPFGSFRKGLDDWKDFFKRRKAQAALDENRDQIAEDIENGDYNKVAATAMRAGDENMAAEYAKLRDQAEARQAQTAYQNAMIASRESEGALNRQIRRDALDAKAEEKAEKKAAEQKAAADMHNSAVSGLRSLKQLADSGEINKWNNESKDWWLAKSSQENLGKRQAALSALGPALIDIARKSGASGINSLGEAMFYLGIPENATSSEIAGTIPMLMERLGITEDELNLAPAAIPVAASKPTPNNTTQSGGGMAF